MADLTAPALIVHAAVLLGAYLLGSIPFGLLFTRLAGLGDIRRIGSGNIGATNVLRTGRRGLALATLLADAGKGALAVLLAGEIAPALGLTAALGAFLGHLFPLWLGFRGGKGVATFLGVELALFWPVGLLACAAWLIGTALTRFSSAGALSAAAATPLIAWAFGRPDLAWLSLPLAALIWLRHAENIRRILRGEEPRIGARRRAPLP